MRNVGPGAVHLTVTIKLRGVGVVENVESSSSFQHFQQPTTTTILMKESEGYGKDRKILDITS